MPAPDPIYRYHSPTTRATSGFGATLRRLREAGRTSQSRLAERAGFDHSYVSRLECGARTPTREAAVQLAEALGLDHAGQDSLLAAAGFLPRDVGSLLAGEPEVVEVLNLLRDETIPADYRLNLREILRLMVQQAKAVRPDVGFADVSA